MAKHIVATNLNLQPEVRIKIVGDIAPDTKPQVGDGKDEAKSPGMITCGAMEKKVKKFPSVPGSRAEIYIIFEEKQFKVKLPGGSEFTFPNHLNLQLINFLEITKDFKLRMLSFE
uniref:Galectin n=1 Tax=Phascolarctos cinereus TaxID=38626 RepID=A0A6P5JYS6_PHACI|nr:galectin-1-like [Phascolarctos cinereus]